MSLISGGVGGLAIAQDVAALGERPITLVHLDKNSGLVVGGSREAIDAAYVVRVEFFAGKGFGEIVVVFSALDLKLYTSLAAFRLLDFMLEFPDFSSRSSHATTRTHGNYASSV